MSDTTCPEGAHEKPWLLGASRHRPDTRSPLLWHSTRCSWPSHLRARGAAEDRGEGRRGQFDPWTHRIRTGRASRPRHDPHSAHLGAVRTSSSAEEISATTQRTEASPAAAELRRPFLSSSDALRGCAAMSLRAGGSLARRATAQSWAERTVRPKSWAEFCGIGTESASIEGQGTIAAVSCKCYCRGCLGLVWIPSETFGLTPTHGRHGHPTEPMACRARRARACKL